MASPPSLTVNLTVSCPLDIVCIPLFVWVWRVGQKIVIPPTATRIVGGAVPCCSVIALLCLLVGRLVSFLKHAIFFIEETPINSGSPDSYLSS